MTTSAAPNPSTNVLQELLASSQRIEELLEKAAAAQGSGGSPLASALAGGAVGAAIGGLSVQDQYVQHSEGATQQAQLSELRAELALNRHASSKQNESLLDTLGNLPGADKGMQATAFNGAALAKAHADAAAKDAKNYKDEADALHQLADHASTQAYRHQGAAPPPASGGQPPAPGSGSGQGAGKNNFFANLTKAGLVAGAVKTMFFGGSGGTTSNYATHEAANQSTLHYATVLHKIFSTPLFNVGVGGVLNGSGFGEK